MKILVWVCEECKTRCIARFNGTRTGYYKQLKRPFESCIWEEGRYWMDKNPWKLRKMEESDIVKYFLDANKKWEERKKESSNEESNISNA